MTRLWFILAGWCVLAAFVAAKANEGPKGPDDALDTVQENLSLVATELQKYREKNDRFPTNDEGLSVVVPRGLEAWFGESRFRKAYYLRPMDVGIRGWAGVPLVYENRRGLPEAAFAGSPAKPGEDVPWCVTVDEGIYVYSLPGRNLQAEVDAAKTARIAWLTPLLLGAVVFFILGACAADKAPMGIQIANWVLGSALALLGVVFGFDNCGVIACYPGTVIRMTRDRQAAEQYAGLLETYRNRGVIREETYKKLIEADKNMEEMW